MRNEVADLLLSTLLKRRLQNNLFIRNTKKYGTGKQGISTCCTHCNTKGSYREISLF